MVDGIVLDIEPFEAELGAQPLGVYQRREARKSPHVGLLVYRQQFPIAPQIARARFDDLVSQSAADTRVIVNDFQRAEAGFAHVQRLQRVLLAAFSALESGDVTHSFPSM